MKFTYTGESEMVFPTVNLIDGSVLTAVPGQTYDLLAAPESDLFTAAADSLTAIASGQEAHALTRIGQLAAKSREDSGTVAAVVQEAPQSAPEPSEAPSEPTPPETPTTGAESV